MKILLISWCCFGFFLPLAYATGQQFVAGEVLVELEPEASIDRVIEDLSFLFRTDFKPQLASFGLKSALLYRLKLRGETSVLSAVAHLEKQKDVGQAQPNYLTTIPAEEKIFGYPCIAGFEVEGCDPKAPVPCIAGFDVPGCDPLAEIPCLAPGVAFPPGCLDLESKKKEKVFKGQGDPSFQGVVRFKGPRREDRFLEYLWGHERVSVQEAWKFAQQRKVITVAVVDTGIDYNHEDLAPNLWFQRRGSQRRIGFDFVDNDAFPFDFDGHGTQVAGVIGAVHGNGVGISGVATYVRLMPIRFIAESGFGTTEGAVNAIDFAIENGAHIINMSWGFESKTENPLLRSAIERAQKKGILVVAAAGNNQSPNAQLHKSYPASYDLDNILSVASSGPVDYLSDFSNLASKMDLAAPGELIFSTFPGNTYSITAGSSLAAPFVSGAAALIWATYPNWDYRQVKRVILDNVDSLRPLGSSPRFGRLNIGKIFTRY